MKKMNQNQSTQLSVQPEICNKWRDHLKKRIKGSVRMNNQLGFLQDFIKDNLPETKIQYQPYATYEMEKIEEGDWMDARVYGATQIVPSPSINYRNGEGDKVFLERKIQKREIPIQKGVYEGEEVDYIPYRKGDTLLLDLGFTATLPFNCEAYILPRSSLFKKTGLIQTNGMGVVDNSYCGPKDVWKMPVYAEMSGFLIIGERVCQWRPMERATFNLVKITSTETSDSREGFGQSGEM